MQHPKRRSIARCPGRSLALLALASSACTSGTQENVATTSNHRPATVDARPAGENGTEPSCGHETLTHGRGYDAAARSCLWDAWIGRSPAQLVITSHTIEGDPIVYTLRTRAEPGVEVTVDSSADRFGSRGVLRSTCETLEKRAGTGDRFGFVLRGCSDGVPEIVIP
jgi:hypothetical protein